MAPSPLLSRVPIGALGGCQSSGVTLPVEMLGTDTSVGSRAEARLSPHPPATLRVRPVARRQGPFSLLGSAEVGDVRG